MKRNKKHFFGIMLSLMLMVGMMPVLGLSQMAYAAGPVTWSENQTFDSDASFEYGVNVTGDITVTIAEGKTVTVKNGINAEGKTLTVAGKGKLIVTGSLGAPGGPGVHGNVTVNSGSITVNGGAGGPGTPGSSGGNGGAGVKGNVTVNSGSITVTGGNGGAGGLSGPDTPGGSGGNGGAGVKGNVTVNSGSITVNGGACGPEAPGGSGGSGGNGVEGTVTVSAGLATATGGGLGGPGGDHGIAATGTLSGTTVVKDSDDGETWAEIASGTASTKRYVKVEGIVGYPLWVGGVQVTSANMSGDGWSYTPAPDDETPATLTLNNYTYNSGAFYDSAICADENLTIELVGNNNVDSTLVEANHYAIYAFGQLTIQGSGRLDTKGKRVGIYANKGLTIEGCNVIARSTETTEGEYICGGISSANKGDDITIKNATVKANAVVGNAIDSGGDVIIEDSTVEAHSTNHIGVFSYEGNVEIKDGSNVIASGEKKAIKGTVKNAIAGTGWTNTEGTEGKTAIPISKDGQELNEYKKIQFPAKADPEPTPKKPQTVGKTTIRNTIANSAKKIYDVLYNAVPGATGYDIAYKHKNSSKWVIKKAGKRTRVTIGGISIKGFYQIKVRAKKAETAKYKAATGAWSPTLYRYFHTTEKIRLASKAKGSFTMSWKKNPQATSYQVMFSTKKNGAGAAENINTVGKNATSFTRTGLKSGRTYYVQVREIVKIGGVNYIGNISCPVPVKIK